MLRQIFVFLCLVLMPICLFADSVDESFLFSNDSQQITSSSNLSSDNLNLSLSQRHVGFSGEIQARSIYSPSHLGFDSSWVGFTMGNLLLDIRQPGGVKAFFHAAVYQSQTGVSGNGSLLMLKEFFVDIPVNRSVYLRAGKQVLQWGRAYFWNPTDLINVEKRNFFDLDAFREGTYGLKVSVPIGAKQTGYLFLNTHDQSTLSDTAVAVKYEWVVGYTEMAISTWMKRHQPLIYGFDFSSSVGVVDIQGETVFSYGDIYSYLDTGSGSLATKQVIDQWVNRSVISFSRTFPWQISDQIHVINEWFYNSQGYRSPVFAVADQRDYFLDHQLYVPNQYGAYYTAFFGSLSQFPWYDVSLDTHFIANLSDGSQILSVGAGYQPFDYLGIKGNLIFFLGNPLGEYTYSGQNLMLDLSAVVTF